MAPKRLVIFAEGTGDAESLPVLLHNVLTYQFQDDWHQWLFLDDRIFRIGGLDSFGSETPRKFERWTRDALSRTNFGGLLVVLDADSNRSTCLITDALLVSDYLARAGAGTTFPAAVVLIRHEYEAWLIASYETLSTRKESVQPVTDLENLRGCKEWLNKNLHTGYSSIPFQKELTKEISIDALLQANLRSFTRFQDALNEIIQAIQSDSHTLSPLSNKL